MEGFVLMKYQDRYEEAYDALAAWLQSGQMAYSEDVVYGLENAPLAFGKLFGVNGGNRGKLVVDLYPAAAASGPPASLSKAGRL